jgi:hypothetical protein
MYLLSLSRLFQGKYDRMGRSERYVSIRQGSFHVLNVYLSQILKDLTLYHHENLERFSTELGGGP